MMPIMHPTKTRIAETPPTISATFIEVEPEEEFCTINVPAGA
jgi:hypothetical protein